jgi:hypothetical protein
MLPAAPATFSMIKGWPREIRIGSDKMRASTSSGPPAAAGTTMVIGRVG